MVKNGVLLAAGHGTRLRPFTNYVNKGLLSVNGKPIIEYPIATLKSMGIKNLTIIVGPPHSGQILDYLGDGQKYGISINYLYQDKPRGISQAINLCQHFIGQEEFVVMLGDNIFDQEIKWDEAKMAQVVLTTTPELHRFGVASINQNGRIVKIEEKPKVLDCHHDHFAITGCYLFDQHFFEYFKNTNPSARGEFEITDIIEKYHQEGQLTYTFYGGYWRDAGTNETIAEINNYLYKKENS